MPNEYDIWEDESDDDQQDNRGQSKWSEPRKAWKFGKWNEFSNEDGCSNP